MSKEPALWTGLVVALLGVVFHALEVPVLDSDAMESLATALVTLIGALLVRAKVMPVATIKEAGLSPEAVKQNAENPAVVPHPGP